jgi:hypothetical protein
MTISPPYCGVPSLSHQFPLAAVVLVVEVGGSVVVFVVVVVVLVVVVDAGAVDDVVVVVDLEQDANTMAEMSRMPKGTSINFLFTFYLLSVCSLYYGDINLSSKK